MTEREELFERWLSSLVDLPLMDWQKHLLRITCTQRCKNIYISMPRHNGRYMVYKLVEQFEQMMKEKEMSNKMKEFNMADVHSGYVVKFRNGTYALCMRVGAKFTKVFARTDLRALVLVPKEGEHFFYTSTFKRNVHYAYDPVYNRTMHDPDHDIVEVYGLVEGVKNYLEVGNCYMAHRPLLWKEDVVEMTLEDIEKKLGHKVKLVTNEEPHIVCEETCTKCVHDCMNECGSIGCTECKAKYGWDHCKCISSKEGEPCPYFKEV